MICSKTSKNFARTLITWSLILVESAPLNKISWRALAIISFFLLITFSVLPVKIGTSFKVFSIIGNCVGEVASNNKAKSSTSNSQIGILNISVSGSTILVVYVL